MCYNDSMNGVMFRWFRVCFVVVGFFVASWCSGLVYAEDTISLEIDDSTLSLDFMSVSEEGEFAESSKATITVSTTYKSGYTRSEEHTSELQSRI